MDGAPADTVHSNPSSTTSMQVQFLLSDRYSGNPASQSAPVISSPPLASDGAPHPPAPAHISTSQSLPMSRLPSPPITAPPPPQPSPSTVSPTSTSENPTQRSSTGGGRDRPRRSLYQRIREFLGHGNPPRRRIVDAYSSLIYCFAQIIIVASFVGLTRSVWRSPRPDDNGLSEWDACSKPLGPLAIVWIIRTGLGVYMTIWTFIRTRPR
jgi:hypothetical protein